MGVSPVATYAATESIKFIALTNTRGRHFLLLARPGAIEVFNAMTRVHLQTLRPFLFLALPFQILCKYHPMFTHERNSNLPPMSSRPPVYCERSGEEKWLTISFSPSEEALLGAVITDILDNDAQPLKASGWTWEAEKGTLENPVEWRTLCRTVDAGGPNWEKYARVVGTILYAAKSQHLFRSTSELLILDSAFIVLFTYLAYYFPFEDSKYKDILTYFTYYFSPEGSQHEGILESIEFIQLKEMKKSLFSVWKSVE